MEIRGLITNIRRPSPTSKKRTADIVFYQSGRNFYEKMNEKTRKKLFSDITFLLNSSTNKANKEAKINDYNGFLLLTGFEWIADIGDDVGTLDPWRSLLPFLRSLGWDVVLDY